MKRTKTESITDLLGAFLRNNGLETPLAEYRLVKAWPDVIQASFPPGVSQRVMQATTDVHISSQTLHVSLSSPPLRQHLRMMAPTLIGALNASAGMNVITTIAFH